MDETKNPGSQNPSEISYQVMPHAGQGAGGGMQIPKPSKAPVPHPGGGNGGGKLAYTIIAIIVIVLLGGLAYYFLGFKKNDTTSSSSNTQTSKLTTAFLSEYFAKETCDDQATCGDNADPDSDGLTNAQELTAGTNPTLADTDGDGLADGDEVNIYSTNPANKYTDTRAIAQQSDYNDGSSIKGGYDPLTPGSKYTQAKLDMISANIAQFKLHAPTTATLGLNPDGTSVTPNTGTSINPNSADSNSTNDNTNTNPTTPDTTK